MVIDESAVFTARQWPETDERINNIGRNRTEDDMGHYDELREAESTQACSSVNQHSEDEARVKIEQEQKEAAAKYMTIGCYEKVIIGKRKTGKCVVDVYRVLEAFKTGSAAIDHAIKKLLCAGNRGGKDRLQDYIEAIRSVEEAVQMIVDKERQ